MENVIIFQSSPARTASTVLINALYGIIPETQKTCIVGQWNMRRNRPRFKNVQVLKSHDIDLDRLTEAFGKDHRIYFVCSERKALGIHIDEKYKSRKNVCCFDFDELNETESNPLNTIVQTICDRVSNMMQSADDACLGELYVKGGVERLTAMNKRYEEIKHLPFTHIDDFYEIHGSHRDRPQLMLNPLYRFPHL
jgi:hypothetical protein